MRERPILFSGPMVCAILAGAKTQTRREVKIGHRTPGLAACLPPPIAEPRLQAAAELCPYGQPGDRLWVREAHYLTDDGDTEYPVYAAEDEAVRAHLTALDALPSAVPNDVKARHRKLRPSIHMPRWASRITLEITGVRVERLNVISADDAWAEGVQDWMGVETPWKGVLAPTEVHAFASLWESVNGAGSWAVNPWVWVVEFRRLVT